MDLPNRGVARHSPPSPYTQSWYGQRIARPFRLAPGTSSSCPRCRQTLNQPRSVPSPSRASSSEVLPAVTARWSPGAGTSSARPTHSHEPSRKCRRSHSNTSGDAYAAPGSVRARSSGRVTGSRNEGSIGARVIPEVCPGAR